MEIGQVVVWGTSGAYKDLTKEFKGDIKYLIDNDKIKWGTMIDGYKVENPEILKKEKKDTIIIIASMYANQIIPQLHEYGFKDDNIVSWRNSPSFIGKLVIKKFLSNIEMRRRLKSSPIVLVDVGANEGIQCIWRTIKENIRVVGFEPDSRAYKSLKSTQDETYINKGLYSTKGVVDFHTTNTTYCGSIYPINTKMFDRYLELNNIIVEDKVEIDCDTLDNQMFDSKIVDLDFIKLDTQGSELDILKGSTKSINLTLGIYVEASIVDLYEGQPLFHDLDKFIKSHGFELFDLDMTRYIRKNNFINPSTMDYIYKNTKAQIAYVDGIYLKDIEVLLNQLENIKDKEFKKDKIIKFFIICLLYGFLDYAVEIIYKSKEKNIISQSEFENIISLF